MAFYGVLAGAWLASRTTLNGSNSHERTLAAGSRCGVMIGTGAKAGELSSIRKSGHSRIMLPRMPWAAARETFYV